ncbi:caspase family protein [Methylobacterium sp. SI9]|uniref:caspase family protein n=1 Tax=Methylobacterium guangdongense TaxID=3138811 RepID=UPI00313C3C91
MAFGMSLHIGLNAVSKPKYDNWEGRLRACENDALLMAEIARSRGFESKTLITAGATSDAILNSIIDASQKLESGDTYLLSYSGHGGQIRDVNGDETQDGMDETWCAFDRMIIDDELYSLWYRFNPGVRIVVFSDSCHSGSVVRNMSGLGFDIIEESQRNYIININARPEIFRAAKEAEEDAPLPKFAPDDVSVATYGRAKEFYDSLQWHCDLPSKERSPSASVLLISGCQDNQLSLDGRINGAFTAALKAAWSEGAFNGSYRDFWKKIQSFLPPTQSPNFYTVGAPNPQLELSAPFSI